MVCCASGKNVLHDLFWSAKPPPPDVLEAMETMVDMLHESTAGEGFLELMLSEDKHGYTPPTTGPRAAAELAEGRRHRRGLGG